MIFTYIRFFIDDISLICTLCNLIIFIYTTAIISFDLSLKTLKNFNISIS